MCNARPRRAKKKPATRPTTVGVMLATDDTDDVDVFFAPGSATATNSSGVVNGELENG